ncbi:hypothetical protein P170DRAFT_172018 [Aspergillus steynii IBT 23096]|uniref:Secreted protein n=1 Tax=Aspergillus steynii IBT 23096 TaxID=1392250 RepID=A0A2I2G811_9EURO|nr:uncharacterized protein P170DRAFT_172018 [Aspergillus steynii IBT 23096]PLB48998.1 hypothetical protein P170DRAFT_172018 [Aspergillus steynii IBT 23096]
MNDSGAFFPFFLFASFFPSLLLPSFSLVARSTYVCFCSNSQTTALNPFPPPHRHRIPLILIGLDARGSITRDPICDRPAAVSRDTAYGRSRCGADRHAASRSEWSAQKYQMTR